ncbi:complex I intermediate-associated protein 30, mitochondrial [Nephila pilipes]|uniref:Complex I intermediate-associated protein 30, mitochondrial n=1 Tax=Nephila pilipes TaxID=299642 RepID=A0A8X6PFS7_NEPPI|nr:complex I intermediate-associated protein 30, mitochondrial [Nephila pilipes]
MIVQGLLRQALTDFFASNPPSFTARGLHSWKHVSRRKYKGSGTSMNSTPLNISHSPGNDCLQKWRIGSDKIHNEGNSEFSFEVNDRGKGVFHGFIDTNPPKDGKNRFAGYCGIKSVKKKKSFLRDDWFDWTAFTHLEMRIRGDGRNYMVNLGLGMYYDVNWFDTFTYVLHTRGGPYWEVIRIPFSKFFLTNKGRIHDRPQPVPLDKVNSVGITSATVSGPFHLEIDYIGCHRDESHKEKTAYELYTIPKEYVSG